ncbi:anti-sigma factor [Longivirga aurantiaca]|uniref:Regulator of SigK n=1 Tax=Longivirga aurantiaca TaxID=1837743 RepID=A0ABW1T221_9ACTN
MTNADVHALSGAYALDALEPAESAAFEEHLESCASCRDEVRSLREAAGALALDVAETPPPSLRSSVLAGISQVRPLPPVGEAPVVEPAARTDAPVDDLAAARERRTRRTSPWLVGVAAALALVAGGAVVRAVQLDNQLDSVSAQAAEVTAVLTAADATTTTASVTTGGRAAVVSSASLGKSVLVTDGMAPAPAGSTYQIWYLSDSGAATSAGFVPAGERSAVVLQGELAGATGVGVTVEPEGGSAAPTTTPVLAVAV